MIIGSKIKNVYEDALRCYVSITPCILNTTTVTIIIRRKMWW